MVKSNVMVWIIGITAFLGSLLTLFSGFGLGTLLTPVFGLFFPIHIAVALTGVVHLLNNLFKVSLLGKSANWETVLRFGAPSVVGGFLGATLLAGLIKLPVLSQWYLGSHLCEVSWLKIVIAALMIFFTFMEVLPGLKKLQFAQRYLTLGGLLSGFFGGLSGNQGALRSAFLINAGLDKTAYVATGVVVACLVDLTRLPVYVTRFEATGLWQEWQLVGFATGCAFAGAWMGARYLKKVTFRMVQWVTGSLMVVFAVLLAMGIL
jgi:uncharacterized membrane protein YfcA